MASNKRTKSRARDCSLMKNQRIALSRAKERAKSKKSTCGACGKVDHATKLRCSQCLTNTGTTVTYCNRSCQKADWKTHKKVCGKNAAGCAHKKDNILAEDVKKKYGCNPDLNSPKVVLSINHVLSKLNKPVLVLVPIWDFWFSEHLYSSDGREKSHKTKTEYDDREDVQKKDIKKNTKRLIKKWFQLEKTGNAQFTREDISDFAKLVIDGYNLGVDGISLADTQYFLSTKLTSSLLFDEDGNFMMADVAFPIIYESPPHSGWHYTEPNPESPLSPFSLYHLKTTVAKTPAMQSNPVLFVIALLQAQQALWSRQDQTASYDSPPDEINLIENVHYKFGPPDESNLCNLCIVGGLRFRVRLDGRTVFVGEHENWLLADFVDALPTIAKDERKKVQEHLATMINEAVTKNKFTMIVDEKVVTKQGKSTKSFIARLPFLSRKQRRLLNQKLRGKEKNGGGEK